MRARFATVALVLPFLACSSARAPVSAPAPAAPPVAASAAGAKRETVDPARPLAPAASDAIDALAWYQTSEEMRRLSQAVFASAVRALDAALADPSWSALGQGPEAKALPAAIITDVDETILDNSAIQARFVRDGSRYSVPAFKAWVNAAQALAIPGALELARHAAERGVTLFYVSNRELDEEPGTRRNLEQLGFPLPATPDVVLSRGERPEWGSDKESRRREIARSYRVLLVLGDDLNDFLTGTRDASVEVRAQLAESASARWGTSWFVLPNPLYGSWERAIVGATPGSLPPESVSARKRAALRAYDGPLPPP